MRITRVFLVASLLGPLISLADEKGEPTSAMLLLKIDKEKLRADLETLEPAPSPNKKLGSFPIAIGRALGDKQKAGDFKTPEGVYFTQNHIKTDSLPKEKYGQIAIPLNFPNAIDRLDGKSGSGIWLHGAGDDGRMASAQVTEGCVAFFNADILRLKEWIHPNHSVVVIAKDLSEVDLLKDKTELKARVGQWVEAWKNRRIQEYLEFYADKMRIDGKNKAQFSNYKRSVFKSYKNMNVRMDELRVITHPKYGVSIMNQYFNGDNRFVSNGRKILYWQKSAQGWKIVSESFSHQMIQNFLLPAQTVQAQKDS